VVLIIDIWHPEMTQNEINFMKYLVNNKLRNEKQIMEDCKDDTFFNVIEHNRDLGIDKNFWKFNQE